jgi:hypothetical protein
MRHKSRLGAGMPTNLAIDDRLIEEARQVGHSTKKEAVIAALNEYIRRRKQLQILALFGTIDYEETYDYRQNRLLDRRTGRQFALRGLQKKS